MEKRTTTIKINGSDFSICGYETEEYMQKVALFVDKKMTEIRKACFTLDSTMVAMLTAINLADENIKLFEQNEDLRKQLEQMRAQTAEQAPAQQEQTMKKRRAPKRNG